MDPMLQHIIICGIAIAILAAIRYGSAAKTIFKRL